MKPCFAIMAVLVIAACSPQPAAEATPGPNAGAAAREAGAVHPESGLRIIPLSVTTESGRNDFRVELADTPEAQARGLMFRTELGDDAGMLFPSETPQVRSFWMKNTPLPLDIIFIGADRRILNIHAMTTPYSLDALYSAGPALAVLELRGGRAAELGIDKGDLVEW